MSGKQIFWAILVLLVIIKDPQVVGQLVDGVTKFLTNQPGG